MTWFRRREHAELAFEARADDLLRAEAARDGVARAERPGASPIERDVADLADSFADLSVVFVATVEGLETLASHGGDAPADLPRGELRRALERLPEREREVLRLVYWEDVTAEHVGRVITVEGLAEHVRVTDEVAFVNFHGAEAKLSGKDKMTLYAFRDYEGYRKHCVDMKAEEFLGAAGFARLVVLKRLRPELGATATYRDMFFDEARLAATEVKQLVLDLMAGR
jgi:hypothetical protein